MMGPALEFMISWAGQDVEPTFQVQAYIRLIGLMCLAFGVEQGVRWSEPAERAA